MHLDIRLPIGALFTLLGLILSIYGLTMGTQSLGHNVDLSWGLVILAFGLLFLGLAHRGARHAKPRTTHL